MSLKRFLYYILKPDGRSGQVVNGVVTYSGQPKPLPQTPDGWQEVLIAFERSLDKHGLLTNFTLPLGFVRNGAQIIRDGLYKETIETELQLLIQRLTLELTLTNYNWFYKYFYRGELDLSAAEDGRNMVSVPVMQGGLTKLLKAGVDTVFEFPMNDPACISVKMDGIMMHERANYELVPELEIPYVIYGTNTLLPFSFLNKDGSSSGIAFFSQSVEDVTSVTWANLLQSSNFFAQASLNNSTTVNLTIKGRITFTCIQNTANLTLKFRFLTSTLLIGDSDDYMVYDGSQGFETGETYFFDVDITIPITAGERIYFQSVLFGFGSPSDQNFRFEIGSKLAIEFDRRFETTYIKAYKRFDLYRKLIGKITGDEANAASQLCTDNNNLLITCGDAIRGLTGDGVMLKTSLKDFFSDCDATFMAGYSVLPNDAGIELEDREKYYTEADEIDLGIVVDLVIKPATDLICNTFKFGHSKQDIEDLNGKYDPNGNNQYSGPIAKVVKEYDAVSPYKSGPYEIEILRINLEGRTTTDDNRDTSVFVLATIGQEIVRTILLSFVSSGNYIVFPNTMLVAVGTKFKVIGSVSNDNTYEVVNVVHLSTTQTVYTNLTITIAEFTVSVLVEILSNNVHTLNRPAYSTIESVPPFDPPGPPGTVFNLPFLTPKTMLLRHGRWIRSMNAGLDAEKIKFTSGVDNNNTALRTILAGVTVDEDAEETIASLGDYMFLPWYFIFKTEVPTDLPNLLEENPNRSFIFTDERGEQWRGFLRIAGIAPNDYTPQEFKLLATPNNDITKLIHG